MIKLDPKNARLHNEDNKALINKSLTELGAGRSIVIDNENIVIAGNGVFEESKALGIKTKIIETDGTELIVLKRTDLNYKDEKRRRLAIADNATGDLSEFNFEELTEDEILEWNIEGLEEEEPESIEDDFDTTPPEIAKTILGDLYEIGEHRLICGDSTDSNLVQKLMDGNKIDLILTDPPYGISVVGKTGGIGGASTINFKNQKGSIGKGVLAKEGLYSPVIGDDKPFDPSHLVNLGDNQIIFGGNYFANKLKPTNGWIVWLKHGEEWKKNTFSKCELAWTSYDIQPIVIKCLWMGMLKEGESGKRFHPTQKPVKLFVDIINLFTDIEHLIVDLYLGSGTTMVASHQLKRKCYGMELDPKYCDVIVKRMMALDSSLTVLKNGVDETDLWKDKVAEKVLT